MLQNGRTAAFFAIRTNHHKLATALPMMAEKAGVTCECCEKCLISTITLTCSWLVLGGGCLIWNLRYFLISDLANVVCCDCWILSVFNLSWSRIGCSDSSLWHEIRGEIEVESCVQDSLVWLIDAKLRSLENVEHRRKRRNIEQDNQRTSQLQEWRIQELNENIDSNVKQRIELQSQQRQLISRESKAIEQVSDYYAVLLSITLHRLAEWQIVAVS